MMYKPKNFILEELVCPHVFRKYGEQAWTFFDYRILMVLDFIRDQLGATYVNNWDMGGNYSQRGLRCIQCNLVKKAIKNNILYESAHLRGQAFDFKVKNKTYSKVNLWIISNPIHIPFPIRMEKNTKGWSHVDVCNDGKNGYIVQTFIG